jgi:microcin C transport system permease protein
VLAEAETGVVNGEAIHQGWMLWPPIPFSFDTINDIGRAAPSPPDGTHLLGTDDTARDVLARVIYGFRLSILFTLIVTTIASIIGIVAGALQGFFGGWLDLIFQRFIEIWVSTPSLYIIIIMFAILGRSFWLLVFLTALFGWPALVGVVRAEFLRARNFEYVRAARALGVSNTTIMFRHMLPNAMVATVTLLPFIITGTIGTLGEPRLPRLRPAVLGALAGGTHASGQAEPPGTLARLHLLHHLRGDAVASGLRLRGHPRRLRPAEDLPVTDAS